MHVNVHGKGKIQTDITDAHDELNNWVEGIGKTAKEICNDLDCNSIKPKTSDNKRHIGFVIETNDSGDRGCVGQAIERHLDAIPP